MFVKRIMSKSTSSGPLTRTPAHLHPAQHPVFQPHDHLQGLIRREADSQSLGREREACICALVREQELEASVCSFANDQAGVGTWGRETFLITTLPCEVVSSRTLEDPAEAEQTLGKLWQEFVHQDEGQTSGQCGRYNSTAWKSPA